MLFRRWIFAAAAALIAQASGFALAQEGEPSFAWVTLPGSNFALSAGQSRALAFGSWRQVKQVLVTARIAPYSSALTDVVANRDNKGTIRWDGSMDRWSVQVNEATPSILIRHTAGAPIQVVAVQVYMSQTGSPTTAPAPQPFPPTPAAPVYANPGTVLSMRVISAVRNLNPFASPEEIQNFLLPIQKAADNAIGVCKGQPKLTPEALEALNTLDATIEAGKSFLDSALQQNGSYNAAIQLLKLQSDIEKLIKPEDDMGPSAGQPTPPPVPAPPVTEEDAPKPAAPAVPPSKPTKPTSPKKPGAPTKPGPVKPPVPAPTPTPEPTPEPEPGPVPTPEPAPGPVPTPTPGPKPTPAPGPAPVPTPAPEPAPTPTPEPSPGPTPTPGSPNQPAIPGPGSRTLI